MTVAQVQEPSRQTVTGYDPEFRQFATRYEQGGRVVYSLDFSLAQIAGLIPAPDPKVSQPNNRQVNEAHGAAFGDYVRNNKQWVSPGILLRGVEDFDFETMDAPIQGTEYGIISLPIASLSKVYILDGQHRIYGIHSGLRKIALEQERAKDKLAKLEKRQVDPEAEDLKQEQMADLRETLKQLAEQRARFDVDRVPAQIYITDDPEDSMQMFADITENALGMPTSVKVLFDSRKVVNRVLQQALDHGLLEDRVDREHDQLGRQNENLLSAKHVADVLRILAVGIEGRIGKNVEKTIDEGNLLMTSNKFFDILTDAFPRLKHIEDGVESARDVRNSSIIASPVMMRVLAGVYFELRKRGLSFLRIKRFFQDLDPFLSHPATKGWVARTGDAFFEGALSPSSRRQDLVGLTREMVEWAVNRPAWLKRDDQPAKAA